MMAGSYTKKEFMGPEEQTLLKDSNGTRIVASKGAEPVRLSPGWEGTGRPDDELNFKGVSMDQADLELNPPKDRLNIVLLIMVLHGIGALMPWNMFINAKEYYTDYKLDKNYTGIDENWHSKNFLIGVGIFAQLPNFIFNWLNLFLSFGGNLTTRIVWGISMQVIVFVFTVILAMMDTSSWHEVFFWITMISILFLNISNGIYQNSVFGMAAKLPGKYTAAVILGTFSSESVESAEVSLRENQSIQSVSSEDLSLDDKIHLLEVNSVTQFMEEDYQSIEYMVDPLTSQLIPVIETSEQPKKRQRILLTENFDILKVLEARLEEHVVGKALVNFYKLGGSFDSGHQHHLVDILACALLKTYEEKLHHLDIELVANNLCQQFPNENILTYYIAPTLKHNSHPGGKLWNKCSYLKYLLRDLNKNDTKYKPDVEPKSESLDQAYANYSKELESKNWLAENDEPLDEVLKHWNISHCLRQIDIKNSSFGDTESILEQWPCLKTHFTKELNLSGTFTAIISFITLYFGPSARTSAIYYFITALFVLLACFDTYFALPINRFYRYHEYQYQKEIKKNHDYNSSTSSKSTPLWKVFKQCAVQCFNVWLVFFVTLTIFPAVQSEIQRSDDSFLVPKKYYTSLMCFMTFNVTAMIGSFIASMFQWPSKKYVIIPILLRTLFIPLFLVCNYVPKAMLDAGEERMFVYIHDDWTFFAIAVALGLTSGYFSSVAMRYCATTVESQNSSTAGMFGAAFLVTGVFTGILFSMVMPVIIKTFAKKNL